MGNCKRIPLTGGTWEGYGRDDGRDSWCSDRAEPLCTKDSSEGDGRDEGFLRGCRGHFGHGHFGQNRKRIVKIRHYNINILFIYSEQ